MCCFWQSVPLLRALPASRRQLVFAEGWSAATEQGPGPGLAREPCSSFLGRGQVMSTACAGWQARTVARVLRVPAVPGIRVSRCCSLRPPRQGLALSAVSAWLCSVSCGLWCHLYVVRLLCSPQGQALRVSVPEDRPRFRSGPDPCCGRPSTQLASNKWLLGECAEAGPAFSLFRVSFVCIFRRALVMQPRLAWNFGPPACITACSQRGL